MSGLAKSVRINRLVNLLSSGKHYLTAPILAKELGVTERTIRRDLIDLDHLGYAVYNDRGYKLHSPDPNLHVPFSDVDLSTLQALIEASPLLKLPHMRERCQILLDKLKMSAVQTETDSPPDRAIEPSEPKLPTRCSINVDRLEKAINRRKTVSILYHSLDDPGPTLRLVHPYVITLRAGNWYLIAFTPDKNDFRQYRLERIQALTIHKETFQRDPDFNLQEYFSQSFGVFRGEPIRVKLRLRGKAARLASERPWPKDMELNWISGDTAILQVTLQGTQEIVAWALSLGNEAEILEPEALRSELKSILEELRTIYQVG